MTRDFKYRDLLFRMRNWEFWPAWLFNIPIAIMWFIQGLNQFDLLFFSRVNPDIETGGFFSEEKWKIYQRIPDKFIPRQIFVQQEVDFSGVPKVLNQAGIDLPILVKPNIGERGMGIQLIHDLNQLRTYHRFAQYPYIVQEFIDYPREMSVLAYRNPSSGRIDVTSICLKEKLTITGDGITSLGQLAQEEFRSRVQWRRLARYYDSNLVLKEGEKLELEPIGNHSRGTTFLDGSYLNTESFRIAVEAIFNQLKGNIQYGRFDILYNSIEDFTSLKNLSIVEFNGVGSEPAHIYDPGYPLLKAYIETWKHIKILGRIAKAQKSKGVDSMTWGDFFSAVQVYRSNLSKVELTSKRLSENETIDSMSLLSTHG